MQKELYVTFPVLFLTLCATASYSQCDPTEAHKLRADDGAGSFGKYIAVSGDDTVVGAGSDDVYLFDTTTGAQLAKLVPDDGTGEASFGSALALDRQIVIVGAPGDGDGWDSSGSAYLFDITNRVNPVQVAKFHSNDGHVEQLFGKSVGIDGGVAIIGANGDDVNGDYSGSAYLFDVSDPANPVQLAKLVPDDGAERDQFGRSVAIDYPFVLVGSRGDDDNGVAAGSAYIFDISDPGNPVQIAKLLPDDGVDFHFFGLRVAIDNGIALVGAYGDGDNGFQAGAAYLFDATTGKQLAKLAADDGDMEDRLGWDVSIDGSLALVAASEDEVNGEESGSAYLFDVTTGTQLTKLVPSDGEEGDLFGYALDLSGETAVIGAFNDDDGEQFGSAYIFDLGCDTGTAANVNGIQMITGEIIGNAHPFLLQSSDDIYLHTRSGFGVTFIDLHHMEMRISATTTLQAPSTLDLSIESRISEPAGIAQIGLLNHTTAEFDPVGGYALGNTDAIDTIFGVDATNYVNAQGEIELSIKHIVFVPFVAFTFESFIDHVEIAVE